MFTNSQNSADASTNLRLPTVRVFIEDLYNGVWSENERLYNTRYGPVKRVRILGMIIEKNDVLDKPTEDFFNAETSNSRISFRLDDGTGQIYGTLWGALPEDYSLLKPGMSVLVFGSVRSYKNRPSLTIDYIKHISNPNLETQHILEILRKRKFETQFKIEKQSGMDSQFDSFNDIITDDVEKTGQQQNTSQSSSSKKQMNQFEDFEQDNFISDIQKHDLAHPNTKSKSEQKGVFNKLDIESNILNFISENDNGDGVSKKDISDSLKIDEKELQNILEQMIQDIKIYKARPGYYSLY